MNEEMFVLIISVIAIILNVAGNNENEKRTLKRNEKEARVCQKSAQKKTHHLAFKI